LTNLLSKRAVHGHGLMTEKSGSITPSSKGGYHQSKRGENWHDLDEGQPVSSPRVVVKEGKLSRQVLRGVNTTSPRRG